MEGDISTFADILIRQPAPARAADEEPWLQVRREVPTWLKDTPVIAIDNVAKYFFDVFWDEHETLKVEDFPNVAPPFACFWMEYRVPRFISVGEPPQRVPMDYGGWRFGYYWLALERPRAAGGWELHSLAFSEEKESGLGLGPLFSVRARTDAGGQLVELTGQRFEAGGDWPEGEANSFHSDMMVLHYPPLLAVCFMNCANVRLLDYKTKEGHARRYQRLYGRPPITHKTLDITPMQRVIRSEGGAKCGPRQALHIMRGHFKRFEEKPLFGKHKGMWWWSSQLRGTLKRGYVKKTYEVHPPRKSE